MLEVKGFRGYRFNPSSVGNLDKVITPPFDVISDIERDALSAQSPFNMTHVILPRATDDMTAYEAAAREMQSWIQVKALAQDDEDSFYLLEQRFRSMAGKECVRRGFFGITRIPEPGERVVLGHEKTFDKKIQDRLALTRATRANLSAVFSLYSDPEGVLAPFLGQMDERPPDASARTIDGVVQRMWRVPYDPAVTAFFRSRRAYIADGHHRFATACAYRDEQRSLRERNGDWASTEYVLMGFVEFGDPGLIVYPAHRVLDPPPGFSLEDFKSRLSPFFDVAKSNGSLAACVSTAEGCAVGLALDSGEHLLLRLKDIDRKLFLGKDHGPAWRALDVSVLHRGILENILGLSPSQEFIYEYDAAKAMAYCERGEKAMAFIVKGVTPSQIQACADGGEYMPQKATYLYPKLPTGTVIYGLG